MSELRRRFLFTLTTGRSGTAYLAKLLQANLPAAECHHEILGFDRFGVDTPDVSHMTLFNSQGNVAQVQDFWRRKLARVAASSAPDYVETSHALMKAGLLENLAGLKDLGEIHFVALERDILETLISFRNRYDFTNKSMLWLWYLDPAYPKKIVEPGKLLEIGINGICLWYILEVRARAAYYRQLFGSEPGFVFHSLHLEDLSQPEKTSPLLEALGAPRPAAEIGFPPPENRGKNKAHFEPGEIETMAQIIDRLNFDPEALARDFIAMGRRL